jgi:Icc-related predicted phosphoesterase
MNAARDAGWPSHWTHVGCEYLSPVVESLRPRWVFCGHMHHKAHHRVGSTEIICLSDFHRDPANAAEVINPD